MAQMSQAGDLTSGPMLKKIILFSLPLAASSFLQLLFNAADVVVVGRFAGSAAPATLIWNTMTNSRFSTTLMTPATARQTSGRRVSPTARSREALKLYSMVIGIPMK